MRSTSSWFRAEMLTISSSTGPNLILGETSTRRGSGAAKMKVRLRIAMIALIVVLAGAGVSYLFLASWISQNKFKPTEPMNDTPTDHSASSFSTVWYRNGSLWAAPDRALQGKFYAGVGNKVLWYRFDGRSFNQGVLVSGSRLDGTSPPLRNTFGVNYVGFAYQPSSLFFPTQGYWDVSGRVGNLTLAFVVYVYPQSACQAPVPCSA